MSSAPSPPPAAGAATTKQWILLGVLAGILVLVLAVLVVRPLLAGDPAPAPDAGAAAPVTPTTIATVPVPGTEGAAAAPSASAPRSLDPSIAARAVRDPFASPFSATATTIGQDEANEGTAAPTTGSGGSGGTTGTTTPADGGSGSGGSSGNGTTGTTGTTGGTSGGDGARQEISLVGIQGTGDERTVSVTVDGTSYSGTEGDTLASTYEVVEISSDCVDFRTDDDAFTLCQGQSALK
jgi:hypothetical protein